MGQPLPLPERIPKPNDKQALRLKEMGIVVTPEENKFYWLCALPDGWRWENDSARNDLPCWTVVDNQEMIRVRVVGSWKGAYDNELRLKIKTPDSDGHYKKWKPSFSTHLRRYYQVMNSLEGCGARAQPRADEAFAELMQAYEALDSDEQQRYDCPERLIVTDDGTGGMASGIGAVIMHTSQ